MSAWTQCWEGSFTNGLDKFAPKIRGSLRQYSSCEEVDGGAVLNVRYPAGTTSPKADKPGGANYYCYCFGNEPIGESMKLEYELFLCPDWEWNKGGKLPGINGGERGVGGRHYSDGGFSCRLMWRRQGDGEAYLYIPPECQAPDFDKIPPRTKIGLPAGLSVGRGAWKFTPGRWMKIGLTVCMNSVTAAGPQQDGYLKVEIDGETKIEYGKLVWRKTTNIKVDNIFISTFYGGGDPSWAPSRDTYALFRNFKVYR